MRASAAELPERAGWADGAVRDIAADMAALTLRIVGQTLFAADLTDDSTAVSAALAELLGRFQRVDAARRRRCSTGFRCPRPGCSTSAIGELDAVVARLIAEQRGGLGDDGTVLAMLLRARDEDGRPMPDRQVRDEVLDADAGRPRDHRQRAGLDLAAARPEPRRGRPAARRAGHGARAAAGWPSCRTRTR